MWPDAPLDILAVVPARGNSRRLPRKNLALLGEVPLIAWSLAAARDAGLEDVLLSTEDNEIAEVGRALGYRVPMSRPAHLSGASARNVDVVLDIIDWCETRTGAAPGAILLLQPTSPFRGGQLIRDAIDLLADRPGAIGVIAVTDGSVEGQAAWCMGSDGSLRDDRTGASGIAVRSTGALYLVRSHVVRETRSTGPAGALGLRHAGISTLDIDTAEDLERARAHVASGAVRQPRLDRPTRPGAWK